MICLRFPVSCAIPVSSDAIVKKFFYIVLFLSVSSALLAAQQAANGHENGPEAGGHDIAIWTGGGHSVPGGRGDTGAWNVGLRYGWIITNPHGLGFLKGRFEYAVDAIPAFLIFQPANTAYGAGFNPVNLNWTLATHGSFAPYAELSGGVLYTNHDVPTGTNSVNFMPSLAVGTHILGEKYHWTVELRYLHISNAGLSVPNPGINTVQVRLGIGHFFKR